MNAYQPLSSLQQGVKNTMISAHFQAQIQSGHLVPQCTYACICRHMHAVAELWVWVSLSSKRVNPLRIPPFSQRLHCSSSRFAVAVTPNLSSAWIHFLSPLRPLVAADSYISASVKWGLFVATVPHIEASTFKTYFLNPASNVMKFDMTCDFRLPIASSLLLNKSSLNFLGYKADQTQS